MNHTLIFIIKSFPSLFSRIAIKVSRNYLWCVLFLKRPYDVEIIKRIWLTFCKLSQKQGHGGEWLSVRFKSLEPQSTFRSVWSKGSYMRMKKSHKQNNEPKSEYLILTHYLAWGTKTRTLFMKRYISVSHRVNVLFASIINLNTYNIYLYYI